MRKTILHLVTFLMIIGLFGFWASKLFPEPQILARVGEKIITQDDLNVLIKRFETSQKMNPSLDDKKNLLNLLINSVLINIEAEREKFDQKPEIKAALQVFKNDFLAREYITTKINPLVTMTDEEVEVIMKKNPDLVPKEMRTLKEILVKTEKEAEEIYQELKKGADFSKFAMERSIAESKSKGGLMGTVTQGKLPPSLDSIAFQLKEGEFSRPIKTDEGFEILYLVDRKGQDSEEIKAIEKKVREKVIQLEKNKKLQALLQRKVEELKGKIKVETYLEQLK